MIEPLCEDHERTRHHQAGWYDLLFGIEPSCLPGTLVEVELAASGNTHSKVGL